jgi:hypothetical protein
MVADPARGTKERRAANAQGVCRILVRSGLRVKGRHRARRYSRQPSKSSTVSFRGCVDPAEQSGWLGALQDKQIGHAIALIHREPARAAFARAFKRVMGVPPGAVRRRPASEARVSA